MLRFLHRPLTALGTQNKSYRRFVSQRHGKGRLLEKEVEETRQAPDSVTSADLLREVKRTRDEVQLLATSAEGLAATRDGGGRESDWAEPSLKDLDRSIPQVDCSFIAELVRSRNRQLKDFLQRKAKLEEKVALLTRRQAGSVKESVGYPVLSAFRARMSDANATASSTEGDTAVAVAPEVLAELTDEERDLLLCSRPDYGDDFVLLDCRTVNEVTSWGIIEGAKVLPAHEMFEAFHLTPEEFEVEFGFTKPRPEQKIICYCQYGPRSLMAAQVLSWMGYTKVLHFRDGYYEWGKQYNLLLRRWMLHDKESGNEVRRQVAFQAGLELQREIAPEFNELPMQEAARYKIDTTRSRGTILVGEGLRDEAYNQVKALVDGMEPPLLPGVLDAEDQVTNSGGTVGRCEHDLQRFLHEATGMDAHEDGAQPLSLAEAQEKAMHSFAQRDDNNRSR
ncbi:rhodanese-like domain containing protein, putative [Trypanosoma equiperdum]|nr:hypothetical protein, conserved [Trypanosoma brucei gambiense DAL972]RHW72387.1 rhodanese-like domain containing protein [Trypanosoma brucei equiperdum]CBH10990.1 hypothetical protein, conserved [Trypanosoma brucei gambiense DAL972]SCU69068.1 rhodanese-like domain containing protein, putative [Trypanosoma equiperdum]|eukprot:XP_011773277.1 hypothetical protein, conserved [Trypanosoma brucei gambiense DAL972]